MFLITINHLWTKKRLNMILGRSFGIKEIYVFDAPKELNESGFVVGCVHLQRGWKDYDLIRFVKGDST